jgi:hypothetical protein
VTFTERIEALLALANQLSQKDERLAAHVHRASVDNPWFTKDFIDFALDQIIGMLRDPERLTEWAGAFQNQVRPRRVGLIMAGNIPLVGFHDLLCVFISGHISVIKLSDKDKYLLPFLIKLLSEIDARTSNYFVIVDKLSDFEAVIATGSNNSARYFEQYFGAYPHIIRRNMNAVAVLDGDEQEADLDGLCDDVFQYFGMGCRNVSHCCVPRGYDFAQFAVRAERYHDLAQHGKYKNNLDYNLALYLLNSSPHIALPNLIIAENTPLISPVSTLFYTYYDDRTQLQEALVSRAHEIQCVVSRTPIPGLRHAEFGKAQQPALDDYADGINTLSFLETLS